MHTLSTRSMRRAESGAGSRQPRRRRRAVASTVVVTASALLTTLLAAAGCGDLNLTNPNNPTQQATLTSPEGLMGLGVGLQNRATNSIGNFIYAAGLLADESAATVNALINVRDAEVGIVTPGAGLVSEMWNSNYRTIKTANDIILNAYAVEDLSAGTRSGLVSIAYLFKAGAIADLTQAFQRVAINTVGTETPAFVDRATALNYAVALLDTALKTYNDTAPSAQFTTNVLSGGFNVKGTIFAYRARIERIRNNDAAAVSAADSVPRTAFSRLANTAQAVNRVFNLSTTGSTGALPRDTVRLLAPTGYTALVTYHITASTAVQGFNQPVDAYARFSSATSPTPLYYPDEPLLIKAEALARQNQLAAAQAALDSVRTDCGGNVADDPNACLTPIVGALTQQQIIDSVYTIRRYELFATGLRWEDARRRGLVGKGSVAKRCWLPYPIGERNANPSNVPADPEGTDAPAFPANCAP